MRRAVAADVKATGRDRTVISKAAKRSFFSRVSEATLGSFPGHFWSVLGTKLGGVSAFRVVSITQAVASCKVARLKVSKRRDATGRLSQRQPKDFFSRVSEATLGSFHGHFWSVLGTKLGGVSAFRVVSMSRAVAADVKATGRDRTVISKAAKIGVSNLRRTRQDGYLEGSRVVFISRAVAPSQVARLKASKRQDATGQLSQRQSKNRFF